jgi:acyl carrier protein
VLTPSRIGESATPGHATLRIKRSWIRAVPINPIVSTENPAVSNPTIEERVVKIVCDQMNRTADKITRETSFINDLGADSLDTVELVMEFEDEFEISIPDEDAEKIQTIGSAVDFINSKL